MPPMTWRDTVAPDFSTALGALRTSGDALGQGFGGLGEALGKFNEYNQGQNAAALMANAVKYTNPADLQAAFANGSIMNGVNPGYLTADALQKTQGQVGTLLNNAANTETNAFNVSNDQYKLAHAEDQKQLEAGTLPARILEPDLKNKYTVAQTGLAGAEAGQATAQAGLLRSNTATVDQNRSQNATLFGQKQSDFTAERATDPYVAQIQRASSPYEVSQILSQAQNDGLSPLAIRKLVAFSQTVPAGTTGATAAIAGALPGSNVSGAGGGQVAPATNSAAASPAVFTPLPSDVPVGPNGSPQNAKLQSLLDTTRAVGGMAATTAQDLADRRDQARNESPASIIYQKPIIDEKDKAGNVIGQHYGIAPIDDKTTPVTTFADDFIKPGGIYEGMSRERAINYIQDYANKAGITPAAAAALMKANPSASGAIMRGVIGGYNWLAGKVNPALQLDTIGPNDSVINQAAARIKSGAAAQANKNDLSSQAASDKLVADQATVTTAATALARALADPSKAEQVTGLELAYKAAKDRFNTTYSNIHQDDSLHRVNRDANGNIIPRLAPAPTANASSAIADAAQPSTPGATPTPSASAAPEKSNADTKVQQAQSKVQAALDRLNAAKTRNDPQVGAYQKTASKAAKALQDALDERSLERSMSGRINDQLRSGATVL